MSENNKAIIQQALMLETKQRTVFLEQLEEGNLKEKIKLLLNDDIELTQYILKTSAGSSPLESHQIKDLNAGDRINQFIIVRLIAKGGMGSVYLAYDEKLKRSVAIKTIRSEFIKEAATQQRFKQEAQILSQINHPSICQIYDYIDYDDGDMLVLELVDGITLSDIQLSDQEKLDVFIQIASALEVAHNKDVIHRDLKPDNIMYTADKAIKVLDFGIAKSTVMVSPISHTEEIKVSSDEKPITKMGTLMGTLLYMSPEQAQGKEVTKASDIYSFGIIMQELLTGVTVYDLGSTKELKQQVIQAKKINSEFLSKPYKSLITAMTQRDSKYRPNAIEVINVLKEIKQIPKRRLKKIALFSVITLSILGFSKYTYDLNLQKNAAEQAQVVAEQAKEKAENAKNEAQQVTAFLESLFSESNPYANNGKALTAKEMLEKGSKRINQELAEQPRVLLQLNITIGEIFTQLGQYKQAQTHFDKALDLFQSKQVVDPELMMEFYSKQANLYDEQDLLEQMEATMEKAVTLSQQDKNLEEYYYYNARFQLGAVYWQQSKIQKALAAFDESLGFYLKDKEKFHYKIIEIYNSQGLLQSNMGNEQKAVDFMQKALAMLNPDEEKDLDYISTIQGNLSYMLSDLGQHQKALEYGQAVIDLRKRLLGENHQLVALAYDNIATIYMAAKDIDKCIASNDKALEIYEKTVGKENQNYIVSLANRAVILSRSGENDQEAIESFKQVLQLLHKLHGAKHKLIANIQQSLANTYINAKQYQLAKENILSSLKMYDDLNYPMQGYVVSGWQSLATLHTKMGNNKLTLQTYKSMLERMQSEENPDEKQIAEIQDKIQNLSTNPNQIENTATTK